MTTAAGEQAKSCVDAGVNAINVVSSKAREITKNADGYVHENPWLIIGATAGVAMGVGILAGFLLRGSRRS